MAGGLGARFIEDPRDSNYPLPALHEQLGIAGLTPPKTKSWRVGMQLNQGDTSACVGFSIEGLLLASPIRQHYEDGINIYNDAQLIDEWPGENYDGTSVRAGLQVVRNAGFVSGFYWANRWEVVVQQLAFSGPLILASPWLASMDNPNPSSGFLRVDPSSGVRGGHAIMCHGFTSANGGALHLRNSWGSSWGTAPRGECWLQRADWETLMGMGGEAVAVSEIKGG